MVYLFTCLLLEIKCAMMLKLLDILEALHYLVLLYCFLDVVLLWWTMGLFTKILWKTLLSPFFNIVLFMLSDIRGKGYCPRTSSWNKWQDYYHIRYTRWNSSSTEPSPSIYSRWIIVTISPHWWPINSQLVFTFFKNPYCPTWKHVQYRKISTPFAIPC